MRLLLVAIFTIAVFFVGANGRPGHSRVRRGRSVRHRKDRESGEDANFDGFYASRDRSRGHRFVAPLAEDSEVLRPYQWDVHGDYQQDQQYDDVIGRNDVPGDYPGRMAPVQQYDDYDIDVPEVNPPDYEEQESKNAKQKSDWTYDQGYQKPKEFDVDREPEESDEYDDYDYEQDTKILKKRYAPSFDKQYRFQKEFDPEDDRYGYPGQSPNYLPDAEQFDDRAYQSEDELEFDEDQDEGQSQDDDDERFPVYQYSPSGEIEKITKNIEQEFAEPTDREEQSRQEFDNEIDQNDRQSQDVDDDEEFPVYRHLPNGKLMRVTPDNFQEYQSYFEQDNQQRGSFDLEGHQQDDRYGYNEINDSDGDDEADEYDKDEEYSWETDQDEDDEEEDSVIDEDSDDSDTDEESREAEMRKSWTERDDNEDQNTETGRDWMKQDNDDVNMVDSQTSDGKDFINPRINFDSNSPERDNFERSARRRHSTASEQRRGRSMSSKTHEESKRGSKKGCAELCEYLERGGEAEAEIKALCDCNVRGVSYA